MATQRLTWDDAGKRLYETGVKQEKLSLACGKILLSQEIIMVI